MQPMEWIEENLRELREMNPDATTIQLLSANPLEPVYDKLAPILEKINAALPLWSIFTRPPASRISAIKSWRS